MKLLVVSWVVLILVAVSGGPAAGQSELIAYRSAVLVDHPANDADSFFVEADGKRLHVRLYFVDAPETVVHQAHDARRIQEQARYFGIEQPERIMWLGDQATAFAREVLARPFTLYTAHARALGGAGSQRIYGFVVTANGRDLGELLVENGLGRNFGVTRQRYDGVPHAEVEMRLRDLEISAMLARRGIWSESNPNLIAGYRSQQREEKKAMQAIMSSTVQLLESPLDINTATQRELERIPGIGPVKASRIIEQRPFTTLEELKAVRGISDKLFENVRPYITLQRNDNSHG